MATRSIYQKTCPSCAKQISIDIDACPCGYSFSSGIDVAELPPDEQTAQEQLFEEYIHARIQQALMHLQNLQAALAVDPKNMDKANALMRAFVEIRGLRAELDEHRAKKSENLQTPEPAESTEPTEAFRAAQTERAEKVMQEAGISTKGCPKCRAVLPETAALCFCGFAFGAPDSDRPMLNVPKAGVKSLDSSR